MSNVCLQIYLPTCTSVQCSSISPSLQMAPLAWNPQKFPSPALWMWHQWVSMPSLSFSLFSRACMRCCRGCVWGSLAAGVVGSPALVCMNIEWLLLVYRIRANHDRNWLAWPKASHSRTLWHLQLDRIVWHWQLYFSSVYKPSHFLIFGLFVLSKQ